MKDTLFFKLVLDSGCTDGWPFRSLMISVLIS